ncbi:hypothetical protein ABN028_01725 [Actinopolymorpha sp. B17G11]|uniref:hypothetical protein n=1 Tax=Actinopolymorpha sp. B17G11 TaxID=3160861 RepID=UPI0032E47B05
MDEPSEVDDMPLDEEVLTSDIEEELAGEAEVPSEYDAVTTDGLRPGGEMESDPPDAPGHASRHGVLTEEGRNEALDERLAQEEPDLPRDAL